MLRPQGCSVWGLDSGVVGTRHGAAAASPAHGSYSFFRRKHNAARGVVHSLLPGKRRPVWLLSWKTGACLSPWTPISVSGINQRQGSAHAVQLSCRGAEHDNSTHNEVALMLVAEQLRVAWDPKYGKPGGSPSPAGWRCTGQACRRRGIHLETALALEQVNLQALQERRQGAAPAARRACCARPAAPATQQSPLRKLLPASKPSSAAAAEIASLQMCCHRRLFP